MLIDGITVTDQQWQEELTPATAGTPWVIEWSRSMQTFPLYIAEARHQVTHERTVITLSPDVFRTVDLRKAEVRRQLAS
jgi:hypothetical protein